MSAGQGNIGNLTVNIEAKLNEFSKGLSKGRSQMKSFERGTNSRLKKIDRQFTKTGQKVDKFGGVMRRAFALGTSAVGVNRLGGALNDTMRRSIRFEQQMKLVTGTVAGARSEFKYVNDLAEEMGLSITALIPAYGKFSVAAQLAGMSAGETKNIFKSVSEAATVNKLSMQEQELVFLALEQMINKGVVSMEEMRRQLGDKLVGAFQQGAAAMGVTTAEFDKMVSSGEVFSKDFLPKLARQLHKTYGVAAVEASKSSIASINRMNNAFERLRLKIVNSGYDRLIASISDSSAETANSLESHIDVMLASLQYFGSKGAEAINTVTEAFKELETILNGLDTGIKWDFSLSGAALATFDAFVLGLQQVAAVAFEVYGSMADLIGMEEEAAKAFEHAGNLMSGQISILEEYEKQIKKVTEAKKADGKIGFSKSPGNFITEHEGIKPQSLTNNLGGWNEKLNADLLSSKESVERWWEEVDRLTQTAIDLKVEFDHEGNFEKAVTELQYFRDEAMITTEVFDRAMASLAESVGGSLAEVEDELTDVEKAMEKLKNAGTTIFDNFGDGMVSNMQRGMSAFDAFKNSAIAALFDIQREMIKVLVFEPMKNALISGIGNLFSAGMGGSSVGSSFGSGYSGTIFDPVNTGYEFATGGSFTVGGSGGPDSQNFGPVNLSPGEIVDIRRPGDRSQGKVNVIIHNNSGKPATAKKKQNGNGGFDIEVLIGETVAKNIRDNGNVSQAMQEQHSISRSLVER